MATFTRLKSGSWRVQVRRKGKYVNDTFLRRKDAEEWAIEIERRIDRGEPLTASGFRDANTFADVVQLHREDLKEVGKRIGRSKAASLGFLERRLGRLRLSRARSRTPDPIREGPGAGRRWPSYSRHRLGVHKDNSLSRSCRSRHARFDRRSGPCSGRAATAGPNRKRERTRPPPDASRARPRHTRVRCQSVAADSARPHRAVRGCNRYASGRDMSCHLVGL